MKALCILLFGAWASFAQTTDTNEFKTLVITNQVEPSVDLRVVNGKAYDAVTSPEWRSVSLDKGRVVVAGVFGSNNRTIRLSVLRTPSSANYDGFRILHFPYDPQKFVEGDNGRTTIAFPMTLRLFPLDAETNWSLAGKMTVTTTTYDYGVPYTNKSQVVPKWKGRSSN